MEKRSGTPINGQKFRKLSDVDMTEVQLSNLADSSAKDIAAGEGSFQGSEQNNAEQQTKWFRSRLFLMSVVFSALLITAMCIGFVVHYGMSGDVGDMETVTYWPVNLPKEQQEWYDQGIDELQKAVSRQFNRRRAKNVILFVGDGMGPNTVTAARILGFKEEGLLRWEQFADMGLLKTYCADKQVPDSFSTATALFGGVKVNYETGGVDANVPLGNCTASLKEDHHVQTILKWAQVDGMRTGFVTTTRVTHATPAALYAHVPDRRWECETGMPAEAQGQGCMDIARQLIEQPTGQRINVIMGGGRQMLVSDVIGSDADPLDTWASQSRDGRDLIQDWRRKKEDEGVSHAVVQNNRELWNLNGQDADYVLGIFANGHLSYDHERDRSDSGMPSLSNMTRKALEVLGNSDKGFLLVVEAGLIDQAHHRGNARKALSEVLELNAAVEATLSFLKSTDRLEETLVIVTADHSHSLTINGHPDRGSSILGLAGNSKTEGTPYTTLTYGTSYQGFQVDANTQRRRDPTADDITDWGYTQQAAINTDENLHGGSDVTIHAEGAMSYLFHGVHEQSYVAHAISYALRIGRFRDSSIAETLAELTPI
ncbi:alkaline phosphatase [Drosophila santomea]|uniref:alkaline phosphatase n=1 Tax=Drosophila santomea TaxID=129105 RepID=UPI00195366AB|nr:alkaline phosphatase [Drosophila santomea]XP_039484207.1 alkaline phosphatase [Drosophila santomea]XP_039484208.1 alkaline phosphatase [Drosophila santomea]XP_039484209.1 alkaline phosphatase [Drosophila santomea]